MALVVFFRGINVGGHRVLRPGILAKQLSRYDVANVGATGTWIVRKPGLRAHFCAELNRRLPFKTEVMLCEGRDLLRMELEDPFVAVPSRHDTVRFVSILSRPSRRKLDLPLTLPPRGKWFVRVIGSNKRFVFGVYRRHMKTIGHLGQIDPLFGMPATTRSWNTILTVIRILKEQ